MEKFGSEGRERGVDVRLSRKKVKGIVFCFFRRDDLRLWIRGSGSRGEKVTGLREGMRTPSR